MNMEEIQVIIGIKHCKIVKQEEIMKIKYATISKTGRRTNNEDYVSVIDRIEEEERWLGVVCDGLGGHAMGEIASETVGKAIVKYWQTQSNGSPTDNATKACSSASAELNRRADGMNHVKMGSTLVMASIEGNTATITHCGDSRCYLMRGDRVLYQTKDHVEYSFGWEMISRCFFSYRHEAAIPETAQFEIKPGDRILLCSDGLYKGIPPEILEARMMDDKSPEEILDVFDFLCEKNSDDNYTAILAIVE